MKRKGKRLACLLLTSLLAFVSVLPVFAAESEVPTAELEKIVKRTFGEEYSLGITVPCIQKSDIVHPYQTVEELIADPKIYGAVLTEGATSEGTLYFGKTGGDVWVLKDYDLEEDRPGLVWMNGCSVGIFPSDEMKYIDTATNQVKRYDAKDTLPLSDYLAAVSYENKMGITYVAGNITDSLEKAKEYWFGSSRDGGKEHDGQTLEEAACAEVSAQFGEVTAYTEICDLYSATDLGKVSQKVHELAVLQGKNELETYPLTLLADENPGRVVKVTTAEGSYLVYMKRDDMGRWYALGIDENLKAFERNLKLFQRRSDGVEPTLYYIELSDGSTDNYLFGGGYLHRMNTKVTYESEPVVKRQYGDAAQFGVGRLTGYESGVLLLAVTDGDAVSIPTSVWNTLRAILIIIAALLVCSLILWKIGAPSSWIANSGIFKMPLAFQHRNPR